MSVALSYPVITGETVTDAHARFCADNGHATHTVDGVASQICPRCGDTAAPFIGPVPATFLTWADRLAIQTWDLYHRVTGIKLLPIGHGLTVFGRPLFVARNVAASEVHPGALIWDNVLNEWRDVIATFRYEFQNIGVRVAADTASGTTVLFFKRSDAVATYMGHRPATPFASADSLIAAETAPTYQDILTEDEISDWYEGH